MILLGMTAYFCGVVQAPITSAVIIGEMNNPRAKVVWRCSDLLAMHRCLGPVPAGVKTFMLKPDAIKAVR